MKGIRKHPLRPPLQLVSSTHTAYHCHHPTPMRFFTKTTAFLAVAAMALVAFTSGVQASDVQLAPRAQTNEVGPRGLIISTVETIVKKAHDVFGHQDGHVIVAKDIVEAKAPAPRAEVNVSRGESHAVSLSITVR